MRRELYLMQPDFPSNFGKAALLLEYTGTLHFSSIIDPGTISS